MIQWIGAICVVGACGARIFHGCKLHRPAAVLPQLQRRAWADAVPDGIPDDGAAGAVRGGGGGWGRRGGGEWDVEGRLCETVDPGGTGGCQRPAAVYFPSWAEFGAAGPGRAARGLAAAQEACRKELERVEAEKAGAASLLPGFGTLRRGRPGHPPSVSLWK